MRTPDSSSRLNVLVVGSGGREHAIVWKLARSPRIGRVIAAPGNPGIGRLAACAPVGATDVAGLVRLAREAECSLVVVGPEAPLAAGLADAMRAIGVTVFGPSAAAARIESSKHYAKGVMARAGIPTAHCEAFTDVGRARDAARTIAQEAGGVVVKLDCLAAGKGVVVADSPEEAGRAVDELGAMGAGRGCKILVEERLVGPEASVMCLSDGADIWVLPPARDHKRALDGDQGPNTGGMGAVAPASLVYEATQADLGVTLTNGTAQLARDAILADRAMLAEIERTILKPAIDQMAVEGTPFVGALFAGLMLASEGPKVLEFNCRLGDPETQAVLPLVDVDLLDLVEAACHGQLRGVRAGTGPAQHAPVAGSGGAFNGTSDGLHSTCVVMASPGYPGPHRTGIPVSIPDPLPEGVVAFHAGTALDDGQLVSAGGRVIGVVGIASSAAQSRKLAYDVVGRIGFEGAHYRRDIGAI
ncbi:MAG TPA: phosphoribosylamine--glycine ligase [Bacillota bacterium]|nr:phosphoribosylamine--glycine ligase [Bacillota bacterium]